MMMKMMKRMLLGAAIAALGLTASAAVPADATGTPIGAASAIGDVMVIDVSGGPKATTFPVSYYSDVDMGCFNCATYKDTKIVLRKVKAGTYKIGNAANSADGTGWPETEVTVNKDYYIGIFPVTWGQFTWVTEGTVSSVTSSKPQNWMSYNLLRAGDKSVNIKADGAVSGDGFMDLLCQKAFAGFDLPTEAQWEIAARAGQTGEYGWYLKNGVATQGTAENVGDFAWYNDNQHPVGEKMPNLWGLYDTAGHELEWCRDEWNGSNSAYHGLPAETPYSAGTSVNRVQRGGSYGSKKPADLRPSSRYSDKASLGASKGTHGFRLCCVPVYVVTLDAQGGAGGTPSVTAAYDEAMPAITVPTKAGWAFAGYFDATTGGTKYYNADGTSARAWNKTANTTLYAQWAANGYTVTLDAQGGEGGTASVTATYDAAMPAATMPVKTGYTFGGYFDADGKRYYNADGTSAASWDKDVTATLTARWTANAYTVTLDAQGGEGGAASVTATYDAAMPTATMPTKAGYTFAGYFDATTGGTKYYNADGSSAKSWDKTAATTLYAQWAAPGAEGNPWPVGGDVVAYTNGTGGLVISGTDAADSYSKANPAPWAAFADQIRSVTIADGVTSIGSRFFKGCTHLGTVTGGKNLVSVGENAFYQCMSLETIQLDNADVLDSLKNAIVYQTAIDAQGKFYMIPKVTIAGCEEVLYGKKELTDAEWKMLGLVGARPMSDYGDYRFFKVVLKKIGE